MTLRELYDSISIATIQRFADERQDEHLSLDFKTAGSALTSGSDRKNLAEILSGFSNSAGGLTVWGIATQKSQAGRDVAAEMKPIDNVDHFVTRLREFTPLFLQPANSGISHRAVEQSGGRGFAVTLVPESEVGPHMALAGHDRYFKRAGDRFYRMEHFDIADMFGRRQKASLKIKWSLDGGIGFQGPDGTKRRIQVCASITNEGRASVAAPFIRLTSSVPFEVRRYGASSKAYGEAQFEVLPESPRTMSLIAQSSVFLHPKMTLPVAEVFAEIWDHDELPSCVINFAHAGVDVPLSEGLITFQAEHIATQIGRTVAPGSR